MAGETAYCVKCKEKREIKNGSMKRTKNGRPMVCGKCPNCGIKICRFMSGASTKKRGRKSRGVTKKM